MSTSSIQTTVIERLSRALPALALVDGEDVKLRSGKAVMCGERQSQHLLCYSCDRSRQKSCRK